MHNLSLSSLICAICCRRCSKINLLIPGCKEIVRNKHLRVVALGKTNNFDNSL